MRRAFVSSPALAHVATSGRPWLRIAALLAVATLSCNGRREAPEPTSWGFIPNISGDGQGNQNQGGGNVGGGPIGGSGGQVSAGGGTPVDFTNCGCALETVNTQNAACGDCVSPNDACFTLQDDCLNDAACLQALGHLQTNCDLTPTIECAETQLAGMGNAAADLLIAYFNCVCGACSTECAFGGGTGGAGGGGTGGSGPIDGTCTIAPP